MNYEKACWNKYVFKCFLKEFKELAFLKDAGVLFHNLGPAIENLERKKVSWNHMA